MQAQWGTLKQRVPWALVIAAIAGLGLGLLIGWVLWPVQYTDTDLYSLRASQREIYVQLVADSYALTGDLELATARLRELEAGGRSFQDVANYVAEVAAEQRAEGDVTQAERVQVLATAIGAAQPTPPVGPTATPLPPEEEEGAGGGFIRICLILLFVLLVVVGLLLIVSYLLNRRRPRVARPVVPSREREAMAEGEVEEGEAQEWTPQDVEWDITAESLALGHFVTTFELGDDGYDESFGIETETGEFLGECGVAISEVIGTGTEKPVAFDIWLFDKSDIRTVTTVVVSRYAYEDDALRAKLGAKGDVILAEQGQSVILETATLRVNAEVIDMEYGSEGDLPDESFFEKFTVELSPSTKPGA